MNKMKYRKKKKETHNDGDSSKRHRSHVQSSWKPKLEQLEQQNK